MGLTPPPPQIQTVIYLILGGGPIACSKTLFKKFTTWCSNERGGGQRLFEQCSKKLHFSYGTASLTYRGPHPNEKRSKCILAIVMIWTATLALVIFSRARLEIAMIVSLPPAHVSLDTLFKVVVRAGSCVAPFLFRGSLVVLTISYNQFLLLIVSIKILITIDHQMVRRKR